MNPYQLGESGDKRAIEYLIYYLHSGTLNEKRLAASAVNKLYTRYPNECEEAKEFLLENLKHIESPQIIQYSLLTLKNFKLNSDELALIHEVKMNDTKAYNRRIANEILNILNIPTDFQNYEMTIESEDPVRKNFIKNIIPVKESTKIYPKKDGYVYFLKENVSGTYKIGRTRNLNERITNFKITLPFQVEVVKTIYCEDYYYAELAFHKYFQNKRANGEWFKLANNDIQLLEKGIYNDELSFFILGYY